MSISGQHMNKLLRLFDDYILKIGVLFVLAFTALYPKLPSILVPHTWVYIRLEDFSIAVVVCLWLLQVLRRKAKLALPVGVSLAIYFLAGGLSLAYCFIFIAPHLANFFISVAALEWFRRIEYMILFFVAFSTIKSVKDIRDYLLVLMLTILCIVLYGFGQHYYLYFWHFFPGFFEKYSFCFPSFQTGNEQFAKGIPLCLPTDGRVTSTFGGHYDLAAYLVIVLPIIFTTMLFVKRKILKVLLAILFLTSIMLLLFTASRTSFATYLIGISATIIFLKKKKLLIPIWILSILMLLLFSSTTAQRFLETIRFTSVVTNSQGQVVGVAQSSLPSDLQNKVSKNPIVVGDSAPTQALPAGSSFITLPQAPVATSVAVVQSGLSQKQAEELKLQYGGLELSTVSGSFLIQKALVYDISFTTRFQGEWPRDWAAFLSSPVFGTGYSSLTLASDNDYLRALGETGLIGFITFFGIFVILGILMKELISETKDTGVRLFVYGLAGGVIGLFANATLIDVFESSKVAEGLWILLGAGAGALALEKKHVSYAKEIGKFLTSHFMLGVYLLLTTLTTFLWSINNFFVGDDFTWLKWAATSTFSNIPTYFVNAQGFFYRPIDKTVMLFLYTFFSFMPQGYHIFAILIHFLVGLGVYLLLMQLFGKKIWAFVGSMLFILLPSHSENVFWIAAISPNLATLFLIFAVFCYEKGQTIKNALLIIASILLAILGLFSYEMAVIFPLLFILVDIYQKRSLKKQWLSYIVFVLLDAMYFVLRTLAHTVAAGGDYSYSVAHFIPNVIGNYFGYLALFLFGENALPVIMHIRQVIRPYSLEIIIIALILVVLAVFALFKKSVRQIFQRIYGRLFLFGMLFAFIALLPFLGLGNIAARYVYFASVGFFIAALSFVIPLFEKAGKKSQKITVLVGVVLALVIVVWYGFSLKSEMQEWQHAGKITYNALGYFKIEQDGIAPGSTLYIINRPILYGNAWVFPVGLPDGLWFIYRDDTQKVQYAGNINDVPQTALSVFEFDKNGNVQQVPRPKTQ